MSAALGHCEDPACLQSSSSSPEPVRLFRCSIHCNRNVCLFHLNAHNIYYEEEKKQNHLLIHDLQHYLSVYQLIFEQHIQAYRELVHQASTILLQNTSTLVPIDQIRPVLEHIQQAISVYQDEKSEKTSLSSDSLVQSVCLVVIKCEPVLSMKDVTEPANKVVVRLQRIDCVKE